MFRNVLFASFFLGSLCAQTAGTLTGSVTMAGKNTPLHHATVRLTQLGRVAETNDEGKYEFRNVPAGTYTVLAHMHDLSDESRRVTVAAGQTATADFALSLAALKQEVTVTASGNEQTTLEAFQSVTSLDSLEIAQMSQPSLGEVLQNEPGVAKRSFGPGNSRPVIRGFDGDRVLIMQDGIPTGSISSQSGDHGESIDPSTLERIEVVKGPATLLYGSNAVGGVVNAITGHHQVHEHPHSGLRGGFTGFGGNNNGHGGGSTNLEYGRGNWLVWGDFGGQRTGDYNTPLGRIENSKTRVTNSLGGVGWFGEKGFWSVGYGHDEGRYGVPFAGEFHGHEDDEHDDGEKKDDHDEEEKIDLDFRRHHTRFHGGLKNMGSVLDMARLHLVYTDWRHRELENTAVGTIFSNRQLMYRTVFDQSRRGGWGGSFGFSGLARDFKATGEEALAPPVKHSNFAGFALQEFSLERLRLQFGGRIETNNYRPDGLRQRRFTGFSGGGGISVPLMESAALVVNWTQSYRAPALEELYNRGPHIGNLTYEIGNPSLARERSNGVEIALRRQSRRLRGEVSLFRYDISNFVFLAPTGEIEDGLVEAEYQQAGSRFTGGEASLDAQLHPYLWLNLGADYVDAQIKRDSLALPRIPPFRGRAGFDFRYGNLSVRPELLMAARAHQVFETELPTAGYAVANLRGSYTITRQHTLHQFSVNLFNAGDRLYRNHLSFIKEVAPEIGRGVRFTYTLRFF